MTGNCIATDTGRYAARENVAVALNERIANAINTSQNRGEAYRRCVSILERYSDMGAADTEGRYVLYDPQACPRDERLGVDKAV
jgi:hypothetical protein